MVDLNYIVSAEAVWIPFLSLHDYIIYMVILFAFWVLSDFRNCYGVNIFSVFLFVLLSYILPYYADKKECKKKLKSTWSIYYNLSEIKLKVINDKKINYTK